MDRDVVHRIVQLRAQGLTFVRIGELLGMHANQASQLHRQYRLRQLLAELEERGRGGRVVTPRASDRGAAAEDRGE